MIFSPDMEVAVRFGRKTQTRRPVKGPLRCPECGESGLGPLCLDCAVRTIPFEPCRYKTGKTYAVQPGRGEPATARIAITSVIAEPVGTITFEDAQAEGFPRGVIDFAAKWIELHDKSWAGAGEITEEDAVLERFHSKHGRTMVWVISFHITILDTPRLLAATAAWDPAKARKDQDMRERGVAIPVTDDDLGYTGILARALPDEPEAVDEDTQKWISENADRTHAQWKAIENARHARDRELLAMEDRMVKIERESRLRRIDVSREMWLLRTRLNKPDPPAAEPMIRRVEAKVYGNAA